jgi:hypothetical protein
MVAISLLLGAFLLVHLLNAHPVVRTNIIITRNSLLPHRFAGVCENCHRLLELGPTPMNRDNMNALGISGAQRRLLLAGQSVEVPTVAQKLRTPPIVRADILPHPYVGVCSNCHAILDVPPSREFMRRAMSLSYQDLGSFDLRPGQIARATAPRHRPREVWRNFWGVVALGCFTGCAAYIVIRILMRWNPAKYKGRFNLKPWFMVHEWSSLLLCLAAIAHWHYSDEGNNLLHISLALIVWLTLGGLILRYRLANGEAKKNVRLAHTQLIIFFITVLLLVIGHIAALAV